MVRLALLPRGRQDVRGQYASGGTFTEFANDRDDGYDIVEWVAKLPGSSGKVGMYGSSCVGATQWLAAETAPPHLTTIVPANTASNYYEGWTYENGAFRLNFIGPWAWKRLSGPLQESRRHRGRPAAHCGLIDHRQLAAVYPLPHQWPVLTAMGAAAVLPKGYHSSIARRRMV
jgi:uncharacterized protein